MSHIKILTTLFLITLGSASSAVADVTLKGTMDVNVSLLSLTMKASSIRQLSGNKLKQTIRVEDSSALLAMFGKSGFASSTIVNAETGEIVTINPVDSSYQVQSLNDAISGARKAITNIGKDSTAAHKPMVSVQVEKSDRTKSILGYVCNERRVRANIVDTTGLFPGSFRLEVSIWTAQNAPGAKEMQEFQRMSKEKFNLGSGSELGMLFETLGVDKREVEKLFSVAELGFDLMMEMKAYMTQSATLSQIPNAGDSGKTAQPSEVLVGELTSTTTEISEKAISPSEFTVPAGFKRVEPAPAVDSSH